MRKYKAVIFDLDGTILNTKDMNLYPLQRLIKEELNKDIPYEELFKFMALPGKKTVEILGFKDIEKSYNKWVQYVNEYKEGAVLFEGFEKVIKELNKNGIICGIASSKMRKQYEIDFIKTGLEPYMKSIVLAEDTELHKPNPEPLLKVSKEIGVQAEECLYVGDTYADSEASKNAKMKFGFALWGASITDGIQADYKFEKPLDILKILI